MKNTLCWWCAHAVHWALLYAAFALHIDGALTVIKFFSWALAVMSPLLMLDKAIAERAKEPETQWTSSGLTWLQAWATLLLLVWFEHVWTGAAWGWVMAVSAYRNGEVKKLRAAAAPAT